MSAVYGCTTLCASSENKDRATTASINAPKALHQPALVDQMKALDSNRVDSVSKATKELQRWMNESTEQHKKFQAGIEELINKRNDDMNAKLDSIRDIVLRHPGSLPGKSAYSVLSLNEQTNLDPTSRTGAPAVKPDSVGIKLPAESSATPMPTGTESKRSLKDMVNKVKKINKLKFMWEKPRHHNVDVEHPEVVLAVDDDKMLVDDLMKQMGLMPDEPPEAKTRKQRFKEFLVSTHFDLSVGFLIILNSVVMALSLEFEGRKNALELGQEPDTDWWPSADTAFHVLEHIFSACFLIELLLRLYAMRCEYFRAKANWLDFGIVMTTILDMYVFGAVGISFPNVSVIRLIRIVKLVRVLRIIRVLRFFRQLRILIHSIISSVSALGWSMVLLSIIQLIGAIIMSQTLQTFLRDDTNDLEDRVYIYEYFGTFSRAAITMFEITFVPGGWSAIGRKVIFEVNWNYTIFFLVYVAGVTFAIIRVITAIFLKETLAAAESDREMKMAEKKHQRDAYIRSLQTLFNELDTDGGGHLSLEEVRAMMKDPRVEIWMSVLDLEVHEVEDLFSLLDTGDGEISFDEFMGGLMRLKGHAKSIDVVQVLYNTKNTSEKVLIMNDTIHAMQKDIHALKAERRQ